jgi:hypothetical protein
MRLITYSHSAQTHVPPHASEKPYTSAAVKSLPLSTSKYALCCTRVLPSAAAVVLAAAALAAVERFLQCRSFKERRPEPFASYSNYTLLVVR